MGPWAAKGEDRSVLVAFTFSGFLSGVAGVLLTARSGAADATTGPSYLFLALAGVFLGAVRVNAFGPGFMETSSTLERSDWNSGRRERVLSATPLGRIPGPEELAGAALWLATSDASHMTGNFIMCDGGYSMIGA
jgi:3-oxoacyl-[acyl-carrier protein] reductase